MENRVFPVFVPSDGKKVIIFGGGKIASRRVKSLMEFDFDVTVVSSSITEEIEKFADAGKLTYIDDRYAPAYIDDQFMVIACTDNREVNRSIGFIAKEQGCLVSVCDRLEECNFFFPAIAVNDEVTAGIVGSGKTHHITKRAAAEVRKIIEGKAY
ncbi:Precorrin-2 dehydrogenase [uncultured Eubacterium sp.]|uniref:precorrin-2 dehydrogenase/sirohydrochlorin ferrochelatase family protein n=1 Tax=Emergencia sp. TaxID=1926557 RepID=UPI0008225F21|nr:Precorrin-2 dehydrogenase [uncultured Eubacterium sp.]